MRRQQISRVDEVCKYVVAICVDKHEIKTNGINYIYNNCELAHDVLNVLNVMRGRMEELLQVDMNETDYPNLAVVEEECDEEQEFRPSPELITQCLEENETEDEKFVLAISVLKELSARAYTRVAVAFKE